MRGRPVRPQHLCVCHGPCQRLQRQALTALSQAADPKNPSPAPSQAAGPKAAAVSFPSPQEGALQQQQQSDRAGNRSTDFDEAVPQTRRCCSLFGPLFLPMTAHDNTHIHTRNRDAPARVYYVDDRGAMRCGLPCSNPGCPFNSICSRARCHAGLTPP